MKKKIAILLSCVCIAFPALTYAQSNIQVKLDGNYVKFSGQEPTVINNRTMVPLRGIFENLGYSIEWDADTKTATLKKDDKSISIQTGADSFSVNGVGKQLDVPAQILNGSLMLPLRAIGEAAGLSVVWDSSSKTVIMTNIAEVTNVSTDSKEDIKKYLDSYSQIVKYMASFDELADNMYMVTSDNAEGKLPALISELTTVKSDLEKAKNIHNSLAVPPSLTQLHNLCGQSLNKLEELCDVLNSLFNGKLNSDDAKERISEILEQSKALNTQISSAVNSIK